MPFLDTINNCFTKRTDFHLKNKYSKDFNKFNNIK